MILARLTLRRDAGTAGYVARTLLDRAATDGAHGLIWTAFGDRADRARDFLFREETSGRFVTLSPEVPPDPLSLWAVEAKDYSPKLHDGQRLRFRLRAALVESGKPDWSNPSERKRGKRIDPVLAAHHGGSLARDGRLREPDSTQEILVAWLGKRGQRAGFRVQAQDLSQALYRTILVPKQPHPLGIAEFEGALTVTDAPSFRVTLMHGLGRAKAYGCGLLLVRPV